ncbi:MAG: SUMF1/EgtB/PvdO family nonheme iron enzyme [Krumholzibacteria bacterium]|nr:SUMF1/EgtB/PvdO family nonheme iron enzyme [Candidatus Krumholzibacteria bacterium]
MRRWPIYIAVSVLLGVFALSFPGCGSDDGGSTVPPDTGTVVILPLPTGIDASWTLDLAVGGTETGAGSTTLDEQEPGNYTIHWGEVFGYQTPDDETLVLAAGESITFVGDYLPVGGPTEGFVRIPAGTFAMGSPTTETGRDSDETQHIVTLTTPFLMAATEVTNLQYAELAQWAYDRGYCTATSGNLRDALDGSSQEFLVLDGFCEISFSNGVFTVEAGREAHPVVDLTWYGAVAYCDWLSLREGLPRAYDHGTWQCNGHAPYSAQGYRLPTEAEWEYACRAGTKTPFNTGPCLDARTEANYHGSYPYTGCPSGPWVAWTVPVGSYPANDFGLYDMHGNLWEWCNDWYGVYGGSVTDPVGPWPGRYRVIRGGVWGAFARSCRSALRFDAYPGNGSLFGIGFRPVRSTA